MLINSIELAIYSESYIEIRPPYALTTTTISAKYGQTLALFLSKITWTGLIRIR